jgi:hypothetical protein
VIFGIIVKNLFYQWGQRPVGRIAINLADHSRTLAETQVHWWFSMKIFGKIESHLFGHQRRRMASPASLPQKPTIPSHQFMILRSGSPSLDPAPADRFLSFADTWSRSKNWLRYAALPWWQAFCVCAG